jgi:hypothetical protein
MALVKFTATQRHVELNPVSGAAAWGGVNIDSVAIVSFGTTSLTKRLLVYFLRPGSPDPGPQFNASVNTGALFRPVGELSTWADLVYSGRAVYVRLESAGMHDHRVSTYNW